MSQQLATVRVNGKRQAVPVVESTILSESGKPFLRAEVPTPYYDNAGRGRRFIGFNPDSTGPNTIITESQEVLAARSRDQHRKNPWAYAGIESYVSNCVGTGITPQSIAPNKRWRNQVMEAFEDWAEHHADADGMQSFYGMQATATRTMFLGGECFGLKLDSDSTLFNPMQVRLIEGEQVPLWMNNYQMANGHHMVAGIEFNQRGQREKVHMYKNHPGDVTRFGQLSNSQNIQPIDAENVYHMFPVMRPGQVRGEPLLARVLKRLHEIDLYDDAELVRKKASALFAIFVTSPEGAGGVFGDTTDDDGDGIPDINAEPGATVYLRPGEEIATSDPSDVGANFDSFMRYQLRAIAAGMGISYEQLSGDLTGVNFSSIRAGLLEFRRRCEMMIRHVIVQQFCRPIWLHWLQTAILSGTVPAPPVRRPREVARYFRVHWQHQGWRWVDPSKEVAAAVQEVRAGFRPRCDVVQELTGRSAEINDMKMVEDKKREDEAGLVLDTRPDLVARSGNVQSHQPGEDPPSRPGLPLPGEPGAPKPKDDDEDKDED